MVPVRFLLIGPADRQRPPWFTDSGWVATAGDPDRDGAPARQPRPGRGYLRDDAAVQEGMGAVGIGALHEEPCVMPGKPGVERLPAPEVRHDDRFVQLCSPESKIPARAGSRNPSTGCTAPDLA